MRDDFFLSMLDEEDCQEDAKKAKSAQELAAD